MHSVLLAFAVTGLASFTHAFTKPTVNTWGPLLTPDLTSPVTQGEKFTVTWDPENHTTEGVTVSLVLCHGPSTNCVTADQAIVEGVPAAQKSYDWSVPKDLAPGTQLTDTGYGMLIIVDGTGEFQYSTQFSVLEAKGSSSGSSSTTTTASSSKPSTTVTSLVPVSTDATGGIILGPPAYQTGSYTLDSTSTASSGAANRTTSKSGSHTTASGSAPSGTTSGNPFDFGEGYTTSTASASTLAVVTSTASGSATTGSGSRTTASSAAGVTASTFAGAANHLSVSMAGLLTIGALAAFAL